MARGCGPIVKIEQVPRVVLAVLHQKVSAFDFTVPLLTCYCSCELFKRRPLGECASSADRARLCRFVSSSGGRF